MDSLDNVLNIIHSGAWVASVDLKDAFYTIPIHKSYQNYMKFYWQPKLFKFKAMPNGYAEAMRIFTKILRPPFSYFKGKGLSSVVFVDDTYCKGALMRNAIIM